ncbi:hypothetical protein PWR63_20130 [Paraburkholderia sp. A2WS-5]|uniref:hypothetical protein n=1 Tax=unclassified Paraburkholderia TaxID=2615204 RepID=UPI003B78DA97
MNEPILVNSLELLNIIQRCAKQAEAQQDRELEAVVDTLLSVLVARNGLRRAFVTLPAEVRPYHARACLISQKVCPIMNV